MPEREGLIARVRQIRARAVPARAPDAPPVQDEIRSLQGRVSHLEQLVEALQDSVHRESERQCRLIAELEAETRPAAMAQSLSRHAREHGL